MNLKTFLITDHKTCDGDFANFENAVYDGNMDAAKANFEKMAKEFEEHFSMEEKVLFPSFESKSGMSCGPTEVMRREHEQMRFNIGMIKKALESNNKSQLLGLCESFNILVQQHNSKEEQILYTMCEQVLANENDEIISKMQEVKNGDRESA